MMVICIFFLASVSRCFLLLQNLYSFTSQYLSHLGNRQSWAASFMKKLNQFYGEIKLFCLVICQSWNSIWTEGLRSLPRWSGHCHRGTQKQILHDYYLHDLIQCRFLLFLFGLTRAMSYFFSFNCPLHHLQCILSKDTAGKVRWCFHIRSCIFFPLPRCIWRAGCAALLGFCCPSPLADPTQLLL